MTLTARILGSGSSGGVPRIGNNWGQCDPGNPKNRRSRCSLLVQETNGAGTTTVLIDTSPDLREQLLSAEVGMVDSVLYTHEHADQCHGIDDLRALAMMSGGRVPVWADQQTQAILTARFSYCFETPPGSQYPPILNMNLMTLPCEVTVKGEGGAVRATPFEVEHGAIKALGFRVGGLAYTPDLNGILEENVEHLQGLDCWIVDALRRTPHPSHFSLSETLNWIERINPKRAILTNMHIDMDYAELCAELPENVVPGYDGLTIRFD